MKLLLRILLNAVALLAVSWLLQGVYLNGFFSALLAALILGLVNAFVRPILILLTFPITIFSLGIFILVINAITFSLTAWLMPGFQVNGFGASFFGALLMSLFSWMINALVFDRER